MAQSSGQGSPLPGEELHNLELPENPANFDKQVGENENLETLGAGITLDSGDRIDDLDSEQSGADRGIKSVEPDAIEPDKAADSVRVSKPKKARRSPVGNVLSFPLLTGEQATKKKGLLTGEQKKSKRGKQRTSTPLLTGEQIDDLKPVLPTLEAGFWWEAPADAKGFKIKLRWRDASKKQQCYVFRRLGKFELQTLRKGTYDEQRSDLADRLTGELTQAGRSDLAERIKADTQNHSRFAHPDSAIA